jgi:hypothetical protein
LLYRLSYRTSPIWERKDNIYPQTTKTCTGKY